MKEAVVNESSSDSARVVVTLGDRGKCSGADEVRQNQNAHIEHMYAITFGAGETEVGGFASWSYVTTYVVVKREAAYGGEVVLTRINDKTAA